MDDSVTLSFGEKAKKQLEVLQFQTQQSSVVELLRLGVTLIKAHVEARSNGFRIVLVDDRARIVKEIKLP